MKLILNLIGLLFLLSACSEKKEEVRALKAKTAAEVKEPKRKNMAAIQPSDAITIIIKGVPTDEAGQINGDYVVTQERLIKMPYLKEKIDLTGCSYLEIATKIERSYIDNHIFTDPQITIFKANKDAHINTLPPRIITIQVGSEKPNQFAWKPSMTLLEAIAMVDKNDPIGSYVVDLKRNHQIYEYDPTILRHKNLKLYPRDELFFRRRLPFESKKQ